MHEDSAEEVDEEEHDRAERVEMRAAEKLKAGEGMAAVRGRGLVGMSSSDSSDRLPGGLCILSRLSMDSSSKLSTLARMMSKQREEGKAFSSLRTEYCLNSAVLLKPASFRMTRMVDHKYRSAASVMQDQSGLWGVIKSYLAKLHGEQGGQRGSFACSVPLGTSLKPRGGTYLLRPFEVQQTRHGGMNDTARELSRPSWSSGLTRDFTAEK